MPSNNKKSNNKSWVKGCKSPNPSGRPKLDPAVRQKLFSLTALAVDLLEDQLKNPQNYNFKSVDSARDRVLQYNIAVAVDEDEQTKADDHMRELVDRLTGKDK